MKNNKIGWFVAIGFLILSLGFFMWVYQDSTSLYVNITDVNNKPVSFDVQMYMNIIATDGSFVHKGTICSDMVYGDDWRQGQGMCGNALMLVRGQTYKYTLWTVGNNPDALLASGEFTLTSRRTDLNIKLGRAFKELLEKTSRSVK